MKSDQDTRFVRLRPGTQALIFFTLSIIMAWSILATAILLMDSIGAGNFREQALRDQENYQQRLQSLAQERDIRAEEAAIAQQRFAQAIERVSDLQSELLRVEMGYLEVANGLEALQDSLRKAAESKQTLEQALNKVETENRQKQNDNGNLRSDETVSFLTTALSETAKERDEIAHQAEIARQHAHVIETDLQLLEQRTEQIFRQVEEALNVSVKPLDKMFRSVGLNPDNIIKTLRSGYSGLGGPNMRFSTKAEDTLLPDELRAMGIINDINEINLWRIAIEKIPFAHPVRGSFRYTSGFGRRWGRMHYGSDFAGPHGTPIHATADGVVIHAGWQSGYGRIIKIKHDFGFETRYAHLSKIRVKVGQRVTRDQRIGDMGNTGRSTGTHLHYEIRMNGNAINPMKYLRAKGNVF